MPTSDSKFWPFVVVFLFNWLKPFPNKNIFWVKNIFWPKKDFWPQKSGNSKIHLYCTNRFAADKYEFGQDQGGEVENWVQSKFLMKDLVWI